MVARQFSSSIDDTVARFSFLLLLLVPVSAAGMSIGATRNGDHVFPEKNMPGFLYMRSAGRCTAEFWSSRREAWPKMVHWSSSVAKVFGSLALEKYRPELTVLEATDQRINNVGELGDEDDAFVLLLRESSAALLNSYARKRFPFSSWKVKSLFIQALVSEEAAAKQAKLFAAVNNGCS